jgi:hypothetical protein
MTFEEWVKGLFGDHVVNADYDDERYYDVPPPLALEYATRLFESSGSLLRPLADANIKQGLNRIISDGDNQFDALFDGSASGAAHVRFVNSIEHVYRDVFVVRCAEVLGHLDEPGSPLNAVCYMWWDIFPTWGKPQRQELRVLDAAVLDLLERLLLIEHDACIESALHGLGHWYLHYGVRVESIVGTFLMRGTPLRPELREYALAASQGGVL